MLWMWGSQQRRQEITAPRQEIFRHTTSRQNTTCHFDTLAYAQIEQTRPNVLINKLQKRW